MGDEGAQQKQQLLQVALGEALGIEVVHQRHHGGDGGIELQLLDVVADLLDGLVNGGHVALGDILLRLCHIHQLPHAVPWMPRWRWPCRSTASSGAPS